MMTCETHTTYKRHPKCRIFCTTSLIIHPALSCTSRSVDTRPPSLCFLIRGMMHAKSRSGHLTRAPCGWTPLKHCTKIRGPRTRRTRGWTTLKHRSIAMLVEVVSRSIICYDRTVYMRINCEEHLYNDINEDINCKNRVHSFLQCVTVVCLHPNLDDDSPRGGLSIGVPPPLPSC